MRSKVRQLLDSGLRDKSSPLFRSKNKTEIKKFFESRGFDIDEKEIDQYLQEERSMASSLEMILNGRRRKYLGLWF